MSFGTDYTWPLAALNAVGQLTLAYACGSVWKSVAEKEVLVGLADLADSSVRVRIISINVGDCLVSF